MTRSVRSSTSAQEAAVRSTLRGPAQASASRSTTNKAASGTDLPTLIRWWVSATTVTNSLDVTRRWRMTVDGC